VVDGRLVEVVLDTVVEVEVVVVGGWVVEEVVVPTNVVEVVDGRLVEVVLTSVVEVVEDTDVDVVLDTVVEVEVVVGGQPEKSMLQSGLHTRKAPVELPGQVAVPKSSVSHSSPGSITPLPQRFTTEVEVVLDVEVVVDVDVVDRPTLVDVVVDARVVDVLVEATLVDVVVGATLVDVVVGARVVVVVPGHALLHASLQLVKAPHTLLGGYTSSHLGGLTT
jgi:hypothetical protein